MAELGNDAELLPRVFASDWVPAYLEGRSERAAKQRSDWVPAYLEGRSERAAKEKDWVPAYLEGRSERPVTT